MFGITAKKLSYKYTKDSKTKKDTPSGTSLIVLEIRSIQLISNINPLKIRSIFYDLFCDVQQELFFR